ncbi:helix-turn-helix transcriptional regulator [Rickettsiella endosymbiont of Dermanyssus gallinae]|uniref:helix-turn-helix transcriptional regulator n=1 Tax=Rickettsiella endosymbiont of Dermanyssus gallinae TaxID=2856608 RepID=UPI001C53244A|nr:LuxR C-terminal-related transcriptional regulator [Rickettsiella endosymbiont of Dermanyssus gallinae]
MKYCFKTVFNLASRLEILGITDFFHIRVNKKSQFFILSNNKTITHHLNESRDIGTLLRKTIKTAICGKISVVFWKNYTGDIFLEKIYQLGIWNGISVALPFDDYIDIFSFASNFQTKTLNTFYLNHFGLIKRFIIFFRMKARGLIEHAGQDLYKLNKSIKLYCEANKAEKTAIFNTINQQIFFKKYFIKTVYLKKVNLTEKETLYLVMLLEGKSMSTIAKEIGVSPRSIESCLETIKSKTGYRTKSELLSAFLESHIYQPSINYERYN